MSYQGLLSVFHRADENATKGRRPIPLIPSTPIRRSLRIAQTSSAHQTPMNIFSIQERHDASEAADSRGGHLAAGVFGESGADSAAKKTRGRPKKTPLRRNISAAEIEQRGNPDDDSWWSWKRSATSQEPGLVSPTSIRRSRLGGESAHLDRRAAPPNRPFVAKDTAGRRAAPSGVSSRRFDLDGILESYASRRRDGSHHQGKSVFGAFKAVQSALLGALSALACAVLDALQMLWLGFVSLATWGLWGGKRSLDLLMASQKTGAAILLTIVLGLWINFALKSMHDHPSDDADAPMHIATHKDHIITEAGESTMQLGIETLQGNVRTPHGHDSAVPGPTSKKLDTSGHVQDSFPSDMAAQVADTIPPLSPFSLEGFLSRENSASAYNETFAVQLSTDGPDARPAGANVKERDELRVEYEHAMKALQDQVDVLRHEMQSLRSICGPVDSETGTTHVPSERIDDGAMHVDEQELLKTDYATKERGVKVLPFPWTSPNANRYFSARLYENLAVGGEDGDRFGGGRYFGLLYYTLGSIVRLLYSFGETAYTAERLFDEKPSTTNKDFAVKNCWLTDCRHHCTKLSMAFASPIKISHISLGHVASKGFTNGFFSFLAFRRGLPHRGMMAPRDCELWAWNGLASDCESNSVLLGSFTYDMVFRWTGSANLANNIQLFPLRRHPRGATADTPIEDEHRMTPYQFYQLRILNNWGGHVCTCLYHVGLHCMEASSSTGYSPSILS